jgi:hypothetical protein
MICGNPTELPYHHLHSAHCESGVTAALLSHHGLPMTEPMAFCIASGLFFIHLPFKSVFGAPNVSFRKAPGAVFKTLGRRLGVEFEVRHYRDPQKASDDLLRLIQSGTPVGLQTNVYWLSYMPRRFRFQFNAHNLVVYGQDQTGWTVSDPVLETPQICTTDSLDRARFAKGFLAPKGRAYFISKPPKVSSDRLRTAVRRGILSTGFSMSRIPLPIFGHKAIGLLASRMEKWPTIFKDPHDAVMQLAMVVRMQEEIGTGGAGFRYLYAAFLQQAAVVLDDKRYQEFSTTMTGIGDQWRAFAGKCARIYRAGKPDVDAFREVAAIVRGCGERERALFDQIFVHEKARPSRTTVALPAGQEQ